MKIINSLILCLALSIPMNAFAETNKFEFFTLDIPENYTIAQENDTIEILDENTENVLIISRLPYASKSIKAYAENLAKQWNAKEAIKFDKTTYSFVFTDENYGECKAYVKQIGYKQFFFLMAGENKENFENIFVSLQENKE